MTPAAQSIQETFLRDEGRLVSDLEAEFMEVALWYDGFQNEEKIKLLRWMGEDASIVTRKMNSARAEKDYKTSDFLRDVLRKCGLNELAKNK